MDYRYHPCKSSCLSVTLSSFPLSQLHSYKIVRLSSIALASSCYLALSTSIPLAYECFLSSESPNSFLNKKFLCFRVLQMGYKFEDLYDSIIGFCKYGIIFSCIPENENCQNTPVVPKSNIFSRLHLQKDVPWPKCVIG